MELLLQIYFKKSVVLTKTDFFLVIVLPEEINTIYKYDHFIGGGRWVWKMI